MSNRAPMYALASGLVALFCLAGCAGNGNQPPLMPSSNMSVRDRKATSTASYTVTDLGTLPQCNGSRVDDGSFGNSGEVNARGQVSGWSNCDSVAFATLFDKGKTANLNPPDAAVSVADSINDSGQVTGWELTNSSSSSHTFEYSNGKVRKIDDSLFPNGSEPLQINKSGQIVGVGFITGSNFHAFLYSKGKMTDLDPFSGFQSTAMSINDAGEIIGTAATSSGPILTWLYSNGKLTNLSQTNEGDFINDNGQIVGMTPSTGHAALYSNGAWTDLGAYQGHPTVATGINIKGQIVGFASFGMKRNTDEDVGLIFTRSGPVDLNTLIPPNTGFTITEAEAINNAGQIAGNANISSDGQQHAVLLTPQK